MQLLTITDPRDNLEKANKRELVTFAHANGLDHINTQMPAILIRKMLRSQGLTNIRIPKRVLGQPPKRGETLAPEEAVNEGDGVELSMEDDLARQYGIDLSPEPDPTPEPPKKRMPPNTEIITEIARLKKECKARGIPISRRDSRETLKAKLGGKVSS